MNPFRILVLAVVFTLCLGHESIAQEAYTLNASAGNVTTLTDVISFFNAQTCQGFSLAPNCTQAQACTAANAAGGAGCTAAQARAASARIWPSTQAGREEFTTFQIAAPKFLDLVGSVAAAKKATFSTAFAALSQVNRDSICTTLGLPAGCSP